MEEISWQQYFYDERYNIAIPWAKNLCKWVVVNVPDFSFFFGYKKWLVNMTFLFFYLYIIGNFLLSANHDILGFIARLLLITFIAGAFYSRMVALLVLKGLEAYQATAKEALNRS
ncbi:MAG TPA: hypothetical protein VMW25_01180 [Clostridia bacterium]|nr:hypothetical protein [Clostridia bacterium]